MVFCGFHFFMTCVLFAVIVCSFISLYVYASAGEEFLKDKLVAHDDENNSATSADIQTGNNEKVKPDKKVLVEQVGFHNIDESNDDEGGDDSQYRYTPNVAPATPRHLLPSSSIVHLEDVSASPSIKEASFSVHSGDVSNEKTDHTPVSSSAISVDMPPKVSSTTNTEKISSQLVEELQQKSNAEKETVIPERQLHETEDILQRKSPPVYLSIQDDSKEASIGLETTPTNPVNVDSKDGDLDQKKKQKEHLEDEKSSPETEKPGGEFTTPQVIFTTPTPVDVEQPIIPKDLLHAPTIPPTVSPIPATSFEQNTDRVETTNKPSTDDTEREMKNKEIMSFTEWKLKKDLEQESHDKDHINLQHVSDPNLSTSAPNQTNVPKKKKKRNLSNKNYASPDCGAKVLDANEGSSNSMAILKEDRDAYMLNPCNVKAWVVVELCERIQIESIDFANFEMFSSRPESLALYVSNRFPAREWEHVEDFRGKPEKTVQSFQVKEKYYAKYVKLEVKKYFGNEHYCPLSLLRVFGITEVEEYEGIEDEQENGPDDTVEPAVLKGTGENSGLFQSAKDAVVEMVNSVAKKFSKNHPNDKDNDDKNNGGIVTLLSEKEFEDFDRNGFVMKCIEQTTYQGDNSTLNPFCQFGLLFVFKKRMCPSTYFYTKIKSNILRNQKSKRLHAGTVSRANFTAPVISDPNAKSTTEIISNEQNTNDGKKNKEFLHRKPTQIIEKNIDTARVTIEKTDTPRDVAISADDMTSGATCSTRTLPTVNVERIIKIQTSFNEAEIASSSSTISTENLTKLNAAATTTTTTKSEATIAATTTASTTTAAATATATTTKDEQVDKTTEHSSKDIDNISNILGVSSSVLTTSSTSQSVDRTPETPSEIKKESVDVLEFKTEDTEHKIIVAEKAKSNGEENEPPLSKSSEEVSSANETNSASAVSEKNETQNLFESLPSESSIQEIQPSKSKEIISNSETESATSDSVPIETSTFTPLVTPPLSTQEPPPAQDAPNTNISSPAEKSSKNGNKAPLGGIPGSKESIIVKLNAKLKSLQKNFEMSMMYLDEMSEKYKTAVEHVDKRHERKTLELTANVRSQQQLLQEQSRMIVNLTQTVLNLSQRLDNISKTAQEQHEKINERHVVSLAIEILLIVFFVACCQRRHTSQQPPTISLHHPVDNETNRRKSDPVMSLTERNNGAVSKNKRSYSTADICLSHRQNKMVAVKRTKEHEDLLCKRNKRKKLPVRHHSSSSLNSSPQHNKEQLDAIRETTVSKTAGLLFYAGKGFLSGLTGAFYNRRPDKMTGKPSRRADALIDDLHKPIISKNNTKPIHRAKSLDLPPVVEEVDSLFTFETSPNHSSKTKTNEICQISKKQRMRKIPGRFI